VPCSSLNKSTRTCTTAQFVLIGKCFYLAAKKKQILALCGEAAQPAGDTVMLSKKAREAVSRGTNSFEYRSDEKRMFR